MLLSEYLFEIGTIERGGREFYSYKVHQNLIPTNIHTTSMTYAFFSQENMALAMLSVAGETG